MNTEHKHIFCGGDVLIPVLEMVGIAARSWRVSVWSSSFVTILPTNASANWTWRQYRSHSSHEHHMENSDRIEFPLCKQLSELDLEMQEKYWNTVYLPIEILFMMKNTLNAESCLILIDFFYLEHLCVCFSLDWAVAASMRHMLTYLFSFSIHMGSLLHDKTSTTLSKITVCSFSLFLSVCFSHLDLPSIKFDI